jgi:DNA-binding GntR family transcriptional regulator
VPRRDNGHPLRLDACPLPSDVIAAAQATGSRLGRVYRYLLDGPELRVSQEHAALILALTDGDVSRAEAFVEQAVGRALWLVGALHRE